MCLLLRIGAPLTASFNQYPRNPLGQGPRDPDAERRRLGAGVQGQIPAALGGLQGLVAHPVREQLRLRASG